MKKIDFRKIGIEDIDGNITEVDFSKYLGNYMYMHAKHIEEAEIGRSIYHEGEVELDDEKASIVVRMAKESDLLYVAWSAIERALN